MNKATRTSVALIAAIIIAIAAIAGSLAYVASIPKPTATTVTVATTKVETRVQTSTIVSTVASTQVKTITSPVTQTFVTTISGTPTTIVKTSAVTKLSTIVTTKPVTKVTTSVVTKTITPTPTTPGKPRALIFSAVGAHWALIKFGADPAHDGPKAEFMPLLYETLFDYDPIALQKGEYKVVPWLAESYTVSPDGLTYTIKIRKGIKFHSGNEMTADDVVYSYRRYYFFDWTPIAGYLVEPPFKLLKTMKDVKKVDDYTIQVTLLRKDPTILEHLAMTVWSVLDSKTVKANEKYLEQYKHKDYGYTWLYYEANDAGTGPYKVKDIKMNERYEFERFDDYWGGPVEFNLPKPYFERIIYIPTNEDADARMRLLRGDLHVVSDFLADTIKALERYKEVKTFMGYYPFGMGLWMHTVKGPLKDWKVRKAIKMAINYTAIREANFGGSVIAQGFFMAGMKGWEKNAHYFADAQYDAANKLLDEAGYPVQEDGWRFHINLWIRPAPRWGLDFTRLALQVREDLKQVKIDAKPIVAHVSEYYAHVFTPGEEMMWIQPWDSRLFTTPDMLISFWAYGNGGLWWYGWNKTTQPAWMIEKVDELYEKSLEYTDPDKRIPILQELEAWVLEYGPIVNLANSMSHIGYNAHITNFFWGAKGIFPSVFYMTWE